MAAIHKLLQALDLAWSDPAQRADLIQAIRNCLTWIDQAEIPLPLESFVDPNCDPQQLRISLSRYLSELNPVVKDTQIPLREGDGLKLSDPELLDRSRQIVVILDNLRSVFNVGSIFRSSECLALGGIALCGITPKPHQTGITKTAMGTTERVAWTCFKETQAAISHYRDLGYRIVALETAQNAISVYSYPVRLPLAIVLGNESLGISQEVLALCDDCIALPVLGWKNSLNVGVAFAVTAYQLVFNKSNE